MKKIPAFVLILLSFQTYAQNVSNVVKINIGSLIVKNFSLQYERAVGAKTSLALGVRFQPYGNIPFQSKIEDWVNDPDIQVGQIRTGNFALTPEFRYYFKQSLKGLYLAPYARYASYKMEAPVNYTGLTGSKTAFFKGDIYSFSGGLLFGSQFHLGDHLILDWYIIGAHIGGSSGELNFTASLTPVEQADLRSTLDNVDIPFFQIEHEINSNGGRITSKGAWAGFRGFAINLGWRF
jgi:hypothetical protein